MFPLFGLLIFSGSLGAAHLFKKPAAGHSPDLASPDPHAPYEPVPDTLVAAPSEADRLDVDHYLKASAGALGLATAGHLVFPPLAILSLPVLGYVMRPTVQDAYDSVKAKAPHIALLDVFAAVAGIAAHAYILSGVANLLYFLAIKGKQLTRADTGAILASAVAETAPTVWVTHGDIETSVLLSTIAAGDLIVVHASELVLADGVVVDGAATLDQQSLTGEFQPAEKTIGDQVLASSTVLSGRITIRVAQSGADVIASNIQVILDNAIRFSSQIETRVDQLANASVMPTVAVAGVSLLTGGPAVAGVVLASNFSEATRVASPYLLLNFLAVAARRGLLVKDGQAIETLNNVDTVVFDKTGTLTEEQPRVVAIHPCEGFSESDVLFYTGAAEYRQRHPIARAILDEAVHRGIELPAIDNAQYSVGFGVRVTLNDRDIRVGSRRFMLQEQVSVPEHFREREHTASEQGGTLVYVALSHDLCGATELRPTLRPEAVQVVQSLQRRGIDVRILSGDHQGAVRFVAEALGIREYWSEALPADKSRFIEEWKAQGRTVCFVGDGLNDTLALKTADVSVSLENSSYAAMASAQIILMNKDLTQLIYALDLAGRFARKQSMAVAASVIPSTIAMGGAILFGLTISGTLWLYIASVVAGLAVSASPLLSEQRRALPALPLETLPLDPLAA